MTENLYEINDLTNSSNNINVTRCGYPSHSITSLQPTPVFTHVNQRVVQSPTTPQNERSPLLDGPHNKGFWNHTQLENSASSMLSETMNSQVIYPCNVSEALHELDSFSKTFSAKKNNTVFVDSIGEKNLEDNHLSEILLSPQKGTPSSESDTDHFSPATNRPSQCNNQLIQYQLDRQNMAYNPYQRQHYGYQPHKPQFRENNLVSVPFNRSPSQYPLQLHENQIHQQQQLTLYSFTQPKQLIPMDVHKVHKSAGSPTNSYTRESKASEQTVFQAHTSHFQGSQNLLPLSHRSDLYQHQQANELTNSFPFKQNASYEDHFEAGEIMPRFVNQTEELYMDLNYHHKQENFCNSHYQNVGSGLNQTALSPVPRGGVLHHLDSYRPACGQMCLSDIQEEKHKHYYRTESQMAEGTKTMLKCILCHREFKSLPALNGHMRSHGGFRTNHIMLKTNEEQAYLSEEVSPTDPMVFPVSVPVKDHSVPINFYNQLKHNDLDASDKSPSQKQKIIPSPTKIFIGSAEGAVKREKKRYPYCLVPLVISPCGDGFDSRGPVLFQSQMRSPNSQGDGFTYTPPPMLSPIRPGSGLFNSVNMKHPGTEAVSRVYFECATDDFNQTLDSENNSSRIKPRINIGCNFQAEIPEILSLSKVPDDIHKANLLWTPCYLDTPAKKQRVDDLLKMACSSVLPGGGINTEYTLHCLFESCGDVMITLEKLLSSTVPKQRPSLQTNYHYTGSDKWTLQEKRQLNKALIIYNKDFHLIQKMVKTKSVPQCVEYYYTWKAKLRPGKKLGTSPIITCQAKGKRGHLKEANTRESANKMKPKNRGIKFTELSENIIGAFNEIPIPGPILYGNKWNPSNIGNLCNSSAEHNRSKSTQHSGSVKSSPSNSSTSGDTESNLIFPCIECGKVFLKVKSRNAHMKTHRQPDDPQFLQLHRCPEQQNMKRSSASPTVGPVPVNHYSVSCSNNGEVKQVFNGNAVINKAESLLQYHKLKG